MPSSATRPCVWPSPYIATSSVPAGNSFALVYNADPTPASLVEDGPIGMKVLAERLRVLGNRIGTAGFQAEDAASALLLRRRPDGDGLQRGLRRDDETAKKEGQAIVGRRIRRNQHGAYQHQAAINAAHADAPTIEETDWSQIVVLYEQLLV